MANNTFQTQYIYTQEISDKRGYLWTKHILSWYLSGDPTTRLIDNTDTRKLLDDNVTVTVTERFTLKYDAARDQYNINPTFENFLQDTAYYHNILNVGTLATNKYSKNLYEYVYKNYDTFCSTSKKIYDMFFKLFKKSSLGPGVQIKFTDKINVADYNNCYIRLSTDPKETFRYYIPLGKFISQVNKIGPTDYKSIYDNYFNYAKNLLSTSIMHIDTLYNEIKKYSDIYGNSMYVWKINEMLKSDALIINNCFGLNLGSNLCDSFVSAITEGREQTIDFLKKHLDSKYDNDWYNSSNSVMKIDKVLLHQIFKILNIYPNDKFNYDIDTWLSNTNINEGMNIFTRGNDTLAGQIKSNSYFLRFLKSLANNANDNLLIYDTIFNKNNFDNIKSKKINVDKLFEGTWIKYFMDFNTSNKQSYLKGNLYPYNFNYGTSQTIDNNNDINIILKNKYKNMNNNKYKDIDMIPK